jgi:UDP-N-acetylmuramoyl-tripeptide--D-alanyl-D-alanine ligase
MATPIPQNRAAFSLGEITEITGGVLAGGAPADPITGVSTDTRALGRGALFVALAGDRFDGHAHLEAAFARGAAAALVDREVAAPRGLATIRVGSTLSALGAIARAHARRWRALGSPEPIGGEPRGRPSSEGRTIVAITGSAGKTTTRVALTALLERLRPGVVHAASGNLNNQIGVPMVLLGLEARHHYAVVEVGTNSSGEIAALARMIEPDAAVLTLIAMAHCEGLGSLDAVAAEKGALFAALPPGGLAVGNADDARVQRELGRGPARRSTYGAHENADLRIAARTIDGITRSRVRLERRRDGSSIDLTTPLVGEAGALACAAAIAVTEEILGEQVTGEVASEAFARADVGGGAGRLVPRVLADGLVLLDDSYNANPASSCASIRAAAEIAAATGRRLTLVLGEMRELGDEAARGHAQVGRAAAESGAAQVIGVAGLARLIVDEVRARGILASFAEDLAEATRVVLGSVGPGDVVLVKGSRGVATERIVRAILDAHGEPAEAGDRPPRGGDASALETVRGAP